MNVVRNGSWLTRRLFGTITPWERTCLRGHYTKLACFELARQTRHVAAAFCIGALLPTALSWGYSAYRLQFPSYPAGLTLDTVKDVSIGTGLLFSAVALDSSRKVLRKHFVRIYDPDKAVFLAFQEDLLRILTCAVQLIFMVTAMIAPYFMSLRTIEILFLGQKAP